MDYSPHRNIYQQLRTGLEDNPDVLDEFLKALAFLIIVLYQLRGKILHKVAPPASQ